MYLLIEAVFMEDGTASIFFAFFKKTLDKCVYTVYNVYIQYDGGEKVNIRISNSNGEPIYKQIKDQIKKQIISGELQEDEALPSIRGFAKDLRISVITTKRAYEELEREGFIYTISQKGSFVAKRDTQRIREEYMIKIEELMREIKKLSAAANVDIKEVEDMLKTIWEEKE